MDGSQMSLSKPVEINVKKNNGITERFSYEKLLKSLVMVEVPFFESDKIIADVVSQLHEGITTKEIKKIVYENLEDIDNEIANKYLATAQLKVHTSRDTIEPFDLSKIANTLVEETGASQETAFKIASDVWKELKKLNVEYLTAPMIREMVNSKLIEYGLEDIRSNYTRLGIPVYNITSLIENGNRDNANMVHNPETIHKHVADEALKQYALLKMLPPHLADAHMSGDIHIHDLEFFAGRPLNCMQHDIRAFIRYGLKVDGTGDHTSVAGAPNHMETLMNHTGEIMLAAQQNMSGGQAMTLWNVFVAPFARGRTYEEIKQSVQMLVYNLNMAYAARGSQVPFTSMGLEFGVPKFLQDVTAYGPKGQVVGTYGDFEEETRLIQRAFTETLLQGDKDGKPHLFPNTIYTLRKETLNSEYEEDIRLVHELSAKYGSSYFVNMFPKYRGNMANYMGCRTCLQDTWTGDWEQDCLRTGNLAYVTLNFPRIGYQSKDEDQVFEYLDEYMDLAVETLMLRREQGLKCLNDYHILPFLDQDVDGEPYYRIDNSTLSFGYVGLNEMLLALFGEGIENPDANKFGVKCLEYVNERANQLKDDTGLRWSVIQTPAESTAYRFATLDKKQFGDKAIVQGSADASYYTNSSHVPVDTQGSLIDKIKIEEKYHSLTPGGHIFHAFMGESYSDPDSLMSLTNKIAKKSDIGFWAYSSALSFCLKCKTLMKGLNNSCPTCGETEDVEWYDRITGYVQQVGRAKSASGGWNAGKRQELIDRRRFEN
ncbi:anaerobic ribonucleoside-triphosphate reductase [Methanobrevibacter woesei]|uniref:Anaerobic ribonucleoside-triphosphate reductase n=1 Tax=Methanobrevibacter woesei TaxID=190976 RepID=A0A2U1S6B8_9EURY|nr:anaerobic ribonucleoside-triphosphate reductase [Methanobrevibacter woesei]MCC9261209.1 anaerobic ribonucleoside-triphosphate reductase [Methanobrevibacter woesei]MCI7291057.1 anaerobic ribonucleoside-triphosphate reductase [Methanobrevibacter woesei]PWB85135.1 anaerobic ribonucleoside-triphosphate reductase [Methanobrevibacter woesei]